MRITRSIIPNLFTLANLFSGFSAIIYIADGEFQKAGLFIAIAGIFDVLDGMMARLTKSTSELGVELDSLCDAVSFGVAPSFMLYKMVLFQLGPTGILLASLPALAGVYRLARFNVQLAGFEDKLFFSGMPIPSGALTLVSFMVLFLPSGHIPETSIIASTISISILVSFAMISTLKYDNLPRPSLQAIKSKPFLFAFTSIALILSIFTKGLFLFPSMVLYLISGVIRGLIALFHERTFDAERDTLEDPDENPFDM